MALFFSFVDATTTPAMAEGAPVCLIVEKGQLGKPVTDRFPYDGGLLQARAPITTEKAHGITIRSQW